MEYTDQDKLVLLAKAMTLELDLTGNYDRGEYIFTLKSLSGAEVIINMQSPDWQVEHFEKCIQIHSKSKEGDLLDAAKKKLTKLELNVLTKHILEK